MCGSVMDRDWRFENALSIYFRVVRLNSLFQSVAVLFNVQVYKQISGRRTRRNVFRLALTSLCTWTPLRRTRSGMKLLLYCYIYQKTFAFNWLTCGNSRWGDILPITTNVIYPEWMTPINITANLDKDTNDELENLMHPVDLDYNTDDDDFDGVVPHLWK